MAAISALLAEVERDHRVTLLWAIESGSRAWGFPSPDSDYDCRFIFVRRTEAYLTPWPERDVIETPLVDDLDVNGWDLGKALRLLLNGNAVVIEWLRSPLVYRGFTGFRDELLALAAKHAPRDRIGRHYLHLGERQRRTYFGDGRAVAAKKIFYALRPAAALRWLRLHPQETLPPMHFPTLIEESDVPADVSGIVAEMIRRKAETRELGSAPLPRPVSEFVDREFDTARASFEKKLAPPAREARREAESLFRKWVALAETSPGDGA
ncbi:nucleotidyltransferase domain-containing protein [Sphingosinicella terrae]|uniref:nucleotidyltransferase domain-containing protein n=1 Tax=Sphingosinicella terrae TaxID=2172047 RepID=UPI0025471FE0|nr:nucleotidyltransferase domain-containing protein [Sphingosinicella terrae]